LGVRTNQASRLLSKISGLELGESFRTASQNIPANARTEDREAFDAVTAGR
jgi:hypothetical protein